MQTLMKFGLYFFIHISPHLYTASAPYPRLLISIDYMIEAMGNATGSTLHSKLGEFKQAQCQQHIGIGHHCGGQLAEGGGAHCDEATPSGHSTR